MAGRGDEGWLGQGRRNGGADGGGQLNAAWAAGLWSRPPKQGPATVQKKGEPHQNRKRGVAGEDGARGADGFAGQLEQAKGGGEDEEGPEGGIVSHHPVPAVPLRVAVPAGRAREGLPHALLSEGSFWRAPWHRHAAQALCQRAQQRGRGAHRQLQGPAAQPRQGAEAGSHDDAEEDGLRRLHRPRGGGAGSKPGPHVIHSLRQPREGRVRG